VASSCRAGLLSHRQQCRVRPAERAVACALYHGPLTRHFAAGCLQAAIFGSAPRSAAPPPSSLAAALTGAREGRGDGLVGCLTAGSGARLGSRAPAASTPDASEASGSPDASDDEGSGGVGLAAPAVAAQQVLSWRERAALHRERRAEGLA